LTVYSTNQLLVTNNSNRYALRYRSNLIYPDGILIVSKDHGPFQTLVEPASKPLPGDWSDK
jgi:hypothetical protein